MRFNKRMLKKRFEREINILFSTSYITTGRSYQLFFYPTSIHPSCAEVGLELLDSILPASASIL